ncbi:MAG: hypothetical protein AB7N24_20565 [Dehalococcoidia bacterium]
MKASSRLAILVVLSACVAGSLVLGCSSRAPASETVTPDSAVLSQASERVASPPTPGDSLDPKRDDCAPSAPVGAENPSQSGPFLATFDNNPDSPVPVCGAAGWDVIVHSRAPATWYSLDPIDAQHGSDCAGPPATHHLDGSHAAAFFNCRNHVMTSINGSDYGAIYFVPNQLVDLGNGPVTIQFDLSTERMSTRDWIDVWVTPWDDNMVLPLEAPDPDLQGPPQNSIQVTNRPGEGSPILLTTRNGEGKGYAPGWAVSPLDEGIVAGTNQAAVRQTFELTLTKTSAKFERLASATAPALVFWDEQIDFPFDTAVLQFGHHSYNPRKDDSGVPATWHWDNIGISKAIPFSMLRSVERYADSDNPVVQFTEPSPAGAMLRFAAIGAVEISTDGGKTWQAAHRQESIDEEEGNHHPEHFSSFWMAVPAGVQEIAFRFSPDDWYAGPYFAQDIALWSR